MNRFTLTLFIALATCAVASAQAQTSRPVETPKALPGAETFIYREHRPEPVRLHVFKPDGWTKEDRRPALIFFFGGGFTHGTPAAAGASWAKWAAKQGMVGIAPDYRVIERFGPDCKPADCIADGRLALRWVQDHADELGIDKAKIVVGGNSAGGAIALWTAIEHAPPGSSRDESPTAKPAALIIYSAVSDLVADPRGKRFAKDPEPFSVVHQLDARMPPTILFHGDADTTVSHSQSVSLHKKLTESGNTCIFTAVPGGNHNFSSQLPEWGKKSREMVEAFLHEQGLLPAQ